MYKKIKLVMLFAALLSMSGCSKEEKKIVVGASSTPHALILEQTKDFIESKGYKLEIKVFDDYVLPNFALESGELDANYFQHEPYLNEFNKENGTHLVSALKVHFEPMGIYSKKHKEFKTSGCKILVPSDKSNYDRALELLKMHGLENNEVVLVEAQTLPLMLDDCDYAVINGNYALSSGVIKHCLATEEKTSEIAKKMGNIIAVKEGNEQSDKTLVLSAALRRENIKTYIESTFGDSVIYML